MELEETTITIREGIIKLE